MHTSSSNICRDNTQYRELVEIKKAYMHPSYAYPSLYTDIAVVELGRRVEYDFKKFGDTPTCLDQGDRDINGELSTVQVMVGLSLMVALFTDSYFSMKKRVLEIGD